MQLREFAERVLFARTLEEKLSCPADIQDEHAGPALETPAAPGRPPELGFKAAGQSRGGFPGTRRLEQKHERGRLLHFFANHELLATELMALVLLRFPAAPAAFRKGVLQTLKDEQEHTRLYMRRMNECGIHFGELPVSGYFWRAVSVMENPMDYVASLCLTFEQANLDFARHFARSFSAVGDDSTAELLRKIYRDEIGHVAYGLKWFRRWKNPATSDWEAFCRQLKFPLSPQRAKGFSMNIEGRRAAGLDPEFIASLDVFSQSKGRTPNAFVFNPFAETRIARGKSFNPPKHQARLADDLENLPQFLCRQDDIVLVKRKPAVEFLSGVKQAGFSLPEFVELENVSALAKRKLGRLRPWAWTPDSVELLSPLFASLTGEKRGPEECFNPGIAHLYSKAWGAELLRKILRRHQADWLCTTDEAGLAACSMNEALEIISLIRRRGHHKIAAKESLGLAGGNMIRLFEPDIQEKPRRWMEHALENGRQLIIEPWLERKLDFSAQLEMTDDGLKLCGYTGLQNDAGGRFQANVAAPGHQKKIPAEVIKLFAKPLDIAQRLHELYAEIYSILEEEFRKVNYRGPAGVDAFAYCAESGKIRLKPVVEINPRYTMGRLTVELMKRVAPGSTGHFRLLGLKNIGVDGFDTFPKYARHLQEQCRLRLQGEPTPRIVEGSICLNDPARAQVCLAVFDVAKHPAIGLVQH